MHLLMSDKLSFSMAIWHKTKVWNTCCFSSKPFLKQLASHVSAATFHLKFPSMIVFLIHPGHWNIFSEGFKVFWVVTKDKVITNKKKIEKHDIKRVHLMYCFNFFRNHLWQHLISYNSFRNMNMCLLEVPMREKCRSSHFQWKGGVKSLTTGGG